MIHNFRFLNDKVKVIIHHECHPAKKKTKRLKFYFKTEQTYKNQLFRGMETQLHKMLNISENKKINQIVFLVHNNTFLVHFAICGQPFIDKFILEKR